MAWLVDGVVTQKAGLVLAVLGVFWGVIAGESVWLGFARAGGGFSLVGMVPFVVGGIS